MNETLNTIKTRFSCRDYESTLPEKEKLDAIALAGIQSPSSMNKQDWKIHVITNKTLLEDMDSEILTYLKDHDIDSYNRFMSRGGTIFYNAPAMFLVLKKPKAELDCGIVAENIALAATSLELDNVICAMATIALLGNRSSEFKEKLQIPEGYEFGIAILVGYGKQKNPNRQPDFSKITYIN